MQFDQKKKKKRERTSVDPSWILMCFTCVTHAAALTMRPAPSVRRHGRIQSSLMASKGRGRRPQITAVQSQPVIQYLEIPNTESHIHQATWAKRPLHVRSVWSQPFFCNKLSHKVFQHSQTLDFWLQESQEFLLIKLQICKPFFDFCTKCGPKADPSGTPWNRSLLEWWDGMSSDRSDEMGLWVEIGCFHRGKLDVLVENECLLGLTSVGRHTWTQYTNLA